MRARRRCWPLHFHRVAPAAILLNVAAVPLSAAVLLAGFAVLALAPLGAGGVAGGLAWLAARALRLSGDLGPAADWLDVRVAAPPLAVLALHVAGLGCVLRGRRLAGPRGDRRGPRGARLRAAARRRPTAGCT